MHLLICVSIKNCKWSIVNIFGIRLVTLTAKVKLKTQCTTQHLYPNPQSCFKNGAFFIALPGQF